MATVALTTAGVLEVVEWPMPHDQQSLPNGNGTNNLSAGTLVRPDTNGLWIPAIATTASNVAGARLLLRDIKPGETGTAIRKGLVGGFNISQAQGATLFVSDTGTVADAAGTVSTIAGRVEPGRANLVTAAPDKLMSVNLPE